MRNRQARSVRSSAIRKRSAGDIFFQRSRSCWCCTPLIVGEDMESGETRGSRTARQAVAKRNADRRARRTSPVRAGSAPADHLRLAGEGDGGRRRARALSRSAVQGAARDELQPRVGGEGQAGLVRGLRWHRFHPRGDEQHAARVGDPGTAGPGLPDEVLDAVLLLRLQRARRPERAHLPRRRERTDALDAADRARDAERLALPLRREAAAAGEARRDVPVRRLHRSRRQFLHADRVREGLQGHARQAALLLQR